MKKLLSLLLCAALLLGLAACGAKSEATYSAGAVVEEAAQIGLVNKVVARGDFDAEVKNYVAAIVANSPVSLRRYKEMDVNLCDGREDDRGQFFI